MLRDPGPRGRARRDLPPRRPRRARDRRRGRPSVSGSASAGRPTTRRRFDAALRAGEGAARVARGRPPRTSRGRSAGSRPPPAARARCPERKRRAFEAAGALARRGRPDLRLRSASTAPPSSRDGERVLTYCNTGASRRRATGTALAVVFAAKKRGKKVSVFACETRPLLQGARLTMWELMRAGIEATLISDNAAATVMRAEDGGPRARRRRPHRAQRRHREQDRDLRGRRCSRRRTGSRSTSSRRGRRSTPRSLSGDRIPIEERDPSEITEIGAMRWRRRAPGSSRPRSTSRPPA